jgi:Gpi18-like mannosyltransferase
MIPIILWILLRILTSIFAAIVSSIKPILPTEIMIPLLPPSAPIATWLERVFLSPWMRWDVEWYQRIVDQGYSAFDGTAQFHPLYPWLATPLARAGISPIFSLLIISSLAGLALFYFFFKLARFDLPPNDAFYALILFAFAPLSFILFAPYPEALFILLAVLSFFFARRKLWWLACLMSGLATMTRQQGIFLLIPVAWELWEDNNHQCKIFLNQWRDWLALILIPTGYVVWLIYRAFFLLDWQVNWSSFQEFIYSFLISPSSAQVVPIQQFIWPWQAIHLSLAKLFTHPDTDIWVNIVAGTIFLFLLALSWKKIRMSYRLYSMVITWISFSYYTGPVHPYMGLPRHLSLAFPVFIGLAAVINKPWLRLFSIGLCVIGISFFIFIYEINTWVP